MNRQQPVPGCPVALVIGADENQTVFFTEILREAGARPIFFENTGEALLSMQSSPAPDLVLLDLHLPAIEVWRFCRLVRSPEAFAFHAVPLVLFSGTGSSEDIYQMAEVLGAEDILAGPLAAGDLTERVRAILRGEGRNPVPRTGEEVVDRLRSLMRKQTHDLMESEGRFARLLDGMAAIAVQGYGPDGTTLYWNKASEQIYGYTSREAIGKKITELIIPVEMQDEVRSLIAQMVKTGEPIPGSEVCLKRKDGSRIWVFSSHAIVQRPRQLPLLFCIDTDIAERKRAEEALRRSEEFKDAVVAVAADGMAVCHTREDFPRVFFSLWNQAMYELTGYTMKEINRLGWTQMMYPDPEIEAKAIERMKRMGEGDHLRDEEWTITHRNGEQRIVTISTSSIPATATREAGVLALFRDITERTRVRDALKETIDRFQGLADNLPALMCEFMEDSTLTYVNKAYCDYFETPAEKLLGRRFLDFLPEEARESAKEAYMSLTPERPLNLFTHEVLKSGERRWHEWRDWAIFDEEGNRMKFQSVGVDITDRQQIEAEVLNATETERERIGRELHDGIGQTLPALAYLLTGTLRLLEEKDVPEAAQLGKIIPIIEQSSRLIHEMARGLFPMELTKGGILNALNELSIFVKEVYGIDCYISGLTSLKSLHVHTARQLYRIAQEAITNSARHSKTKAIWVRLAVAGNNVLLSVRDEGTGISKAAGKRRGMGLRLMQYRANVLGANLSVQSEKGVGTSITCLVPLRSEGSKRAKSQTNKAMKKHHGKKEKP